MIRSVVRRRTSAAALAVALTGGLLAAGPAAHAAVEETGAVSGRVTELSFLDGGDTISGVTATAYRFSKDMEEPVAVPGATDITDSDGQYTIDGLEPGVYTVCIGTPGQLVGLVHVALCHEEALFIVDAEAVEVLEGETTTDVDVLLPPGFTDVALPTGRDGKDLVGGHPFWLEITNLALYGVTTGYDEADGSKTFRPSQPVLREQMAAFLYRLETFIEGDEPEVDVPEVSPFSDVAPTHVFYREILWLEQRGITRGYFDGTFRPSQPVLREQMAAFIYRFDGSEFVDEDGPEFTDVTDQNNVFFDEIEWMEDEAITTGYDEGNGTRTFRPSQPVLREQMAAFLTRYASPNIR